MLLELFAAAEATALHLRLGAPLLKSASSSPCHCWPSAPIARYRRPSVVHLSARFEWPSPSAGPPASSRHRRPQVHPHRTCPSARVCPHLYAPCLLSCFGSPNLPAVCRFSYLFALPLLILVHVLCSEYSVLLFILYYIGLSYSHIRSRLSLLVLGWLFSLTIT